MNPPEVRIMQLEQEVRELKQLFYELHRPDAYRFERPVKGGANGLRLGTTANDKLSLYAATPVVQPSDNTQVNNHWSIGGTNVQTNDTFDGGSGTRYPINSIVKALKAVGILAP